MWLVFGWGYRRDHPYFGAPLVGSCGVISGNRGDSCSRSSREPCPFGDWHVFGQPFIRWLWSYGHSYHASDDSHDCHGYGCDDCDCRNGCDFGHSAGLLTRCLPWSQLSPWRLPWPTPGRGFLLWGGSPRELISSHCLEWLLGLPLGRTSVFRGAPVGVFFIWLGGLGLFFIWHIIFVVQRIKF
jgi:hypothetical protein